MKKKKCELCEKPATTEWTGHVHLSLETRVEYITGRIFMITTSTGMLVFNSDTCISCGRLMGEGEGE